MEIRLKDIKLDYNSEQRKLGGYINVVERASETLFSQQRGKWFNEVIKAGTFTRALQKNNSIPMLLEHDWDKQIAHTANGTLELREDAIGLRFDAIVDEETFNEIQQRNITSCSFGFKVNEQQYESVNPKLEKRYISNIDLFEVSLVANPAYVGSLVEQRNMEQALEDMETETEVEEVVEETKEELVEEVRADKKEDESEKESDDTVEEKAEEEESTDEDAVEQEEEVSSTEKSEEKEDESEEEEEKEERTVTVETTNSDVKADAKEVIEEVIEQTQKDAEFYGEIAKDIDQYKEEVKEDMERQVESLENESLYYTTLAYTKWLEVAKLKQISMNL